MCQGISDKSGKNFKLNGSKCKSVLQHVAAKIRLEIQRESENRLLPLKIESATRLVEIFLASVLNSSAKMK